VSGTGLLTLGAVLLLVYLGFIVALLLAGRRTQARALAGFIPDCLVLLRRLHADARLPRRSKLVLLALVAYLLMPLDLVPDFVPVAGQLDDVIVAALALRYALRVGGPELIREHWPGPEASLRAVLRVAYGLRPEPAGATSAHRRAASAARADRIGRAS
jgi:uncharacterized membrane protein YkvA (DUF1232 family)